MTDISQMLPLLQRGGRHTFRWESKQQFDPREVPYVLTMSLRFSNRARGMRHHAAHEVHGNGVDMPTMKKALEQINLAKLESMKDAGAKK